MRMVGEILIRHRLNEEDKVFLSYYTEGRISCIVSNIGMLMQGIRLQCWTAFKTEALAEDGVVGVFLYRT